MSRTKSRFGYKDKLGIVELGSSLVGFGSWMEQLIAESTGKIGRGVLPLVLSKDAPELTSGSEELVNVALVDDISLSGHDVAVSGSLGEQLLLWEVATVVAAKLLGVNPFDQPDVESAKIASRSFLEEKAPDYQKVFQDNQFQISAKNLQLATNSSVSSALTQLLETVEADSYIAIQAYLDRDRDRDFYNLRDLMAKVSGRPTTFGWGPRFLHSTGQYHKGGPSHGVFLQLIGEGDEDVNVPGRDFGFQELMNSQAAGDANVLAAVGRPVLTLRFRDTADVYPVLRQIFENL
jgi:glucose-6-phosphate isomerase